MDNSSIKVTFDPNEVETCVYCKKETEYKKGDHIDFRENYIEGAGQLCPECANKMGI